MDRFSNDILRFTLAVAGLGLLLGQFLVPVIASETGKRFPEVAHLVVPYSVAGILSLLALQVGLALVWRLASLVATGNIFTDGAVKCANALIACLATAIPALVNFTCCSSSRWADPGSCWGSGPCWSEAAPWWC